MAACGEEQRTLEDTSTWAVAVVCFFLVAISIFIEHLIHLTEKWLERRHKPALVEALEKVKAELMLLGFISLLLTIGQDAVTKICVSRELAATWRPCAGKEKAPKNSRLKLFEFLDPDYGSRRILASKGNDACADRGQVAFVSAYGIHQLHIFIFVLAVFHVLYCIATLALGRTKMRKWKAWEDETKTLEYQYYNDPARFRFARDTTFGRRHLSFWSRTPVFLWIVCFFRQFFGSVTKVDYMTLRHGFIVAHLAPGSEVKFDFHKYISRSLENDFKVVVGISPAMWLFAVLFILTNTHGWYSYLWLPFISLIIILLVGTKLHVIITKMGLTIQERGHVIKGVPVVQPRDDLFWFGRPKLILFLIHFVLFQNAFQLAFFAWTTYAFSLRSCFHQKIEDIAIRLSMGVIIQVLCSYVTLPLYALVTQMGSNMKPTIFNERVATALKNWHHSAKKHMKQHRNPDGTSPFSSRPATPTHGMSPLHLLHKHQQSSTSPRLSDAEHDRWGIEERPLSHHSRAHDHQEHEHSIRPSSHHSRAHDHQEHEHSVSSGEQEMTAQQPSSTIPGTTPRPARNENEITRTPSDFSFAK
ncbi:MLO-like protein 2 isoform X3 [Cucurbita moschata]|uniref:MLO-like protein n=1 Tax=Cucurbita moschata TaxID=3662 RepID=A0A6J1FZA0_CUCMO|nr:MLO-like protein 2 isoform X2 [Cucurbita moschata]XP_022944839.1 MLO-like protein 2 isoform X3 [Cucurbita moschata]